MSGTTPTPLDEGPRVAVDITTNNQALRLLTASRSSSEVSKGSPATGINFRPSQTGRGSVISYYR